MNNLFLSNPLPKIYLISYIFKRVVFVDMSFCKYHVKKYHFIFHQLGFRTTLNIQITNVPAGLARHISLVKGVIVFEHEVKENLHEEIQKFHRHFTMSRGRQAGNFVSFIWLSL